MITEKELEFLINNVETFRVEKTVSTTNMDKFCEAICAFANDMPNSKQHGYLLIGITDDGKHSGLKVNDELLKKISLTYLIDLGIIVCEVFFVFLKD